MAKDSKKKREEKRVMKLRFETKVVPLHVVKNITSENNVKNNKRLQKI